MLVNYEKWLVLKFAVTVKELDWVRKLVLVLSKILSLSLFLLGSYFELKQTLLHTHN